jgi:trehalose 6-phosphate phosphatase
VGDLPDVLVPIAAHPETSALFVDFDGTLSAIVDDPRGARALPGVPELLARLAAHFALVAVISGRPVSFLQEALASPEGVRLIGLYGLERIDPDGVRRTAEGAAPWEAVITDVVALARAGAPEGVYVEPKGLTVTLHWRHAPAARPWVTSFAATQVAAHGLVAQSGRMELELRPPLQVDKGTVVRSLAPGLRGVAVFGDDLGDLPAFAEVAALGTQGTVDTDGAQAVAVARIAAVDDESPREVADQADVTVPGPQGVVALLTALAESAEAAGAAGAAGSAGAAGR